MKFVDLILETIKKRDIKQILNDPNFKIGLEFEFIFKFDRKYKFSEYMDIISDALSKEVNSFSNYKFGNNIVKNWVLQNDLSVKANRDDNFGLGIEVSSPVMSLNDILIETQLFLDLIKKYGYTNDTCGLHINVSHNNIDVNNINTHALALSLEDPKIYKTMPSRENNPYALSTEKYFRQYHKLPQDEIKIKEKQLEELQNKLLHMFPDTENEEDEIENEISVLEDEIRNYYKYNEKNTRKYQSVNFQKNRIEFRLLGGTNYEYKWDTIKNALFNYLVKFKKSSEQDYMNKKLNSFGFSPLKKDEELLYNSKKRQVKIRQSILSNDWDVLLNILPDYYREWLTKIPINEKNANSFTEKLIDYYYSNYDTDNKKIYYNIILDWFFYTGSLLGIILDLKIMNDLAKIIPRSYWQYLTKPETVKYYSKERAKNILNLLNYYQVSNDSYFFDLLNDIIEQD